MTPRAQEQYIRELAGYRVALHNLQKVLDTEMDDAQLAITNKYHFSIRHIVLDFADTVLELKSRLAVLAQV